jgi:MFS family permease
MDQPESAMMQESETRQLVPAEEPFEAPTDESRARRSAMLIVFIVMSVDLLGFGIVLPMLPRYREVFLEPLFPDQPGLQGAVLGLLMAIFSFMQFVFAPIWGRISDHAGRRPFLLLGLVGSVVFYGLFGFASHWGLAPEHMGIGLVLLFVARIGAGICGATVSTAQAVIADCTTPEKRAHGMALIGAAFGIGFTFGPALGAGAMTLFHNSLAAPGYVASGICFVGLVLAVLLMPETLRPGGERRRRGWLNLPGLSLALQTPTVGTLILTFFLSTLAFAAFEPTLALLTKDVLDYTTRENFWVFSYVGLVLTLTQGVVYRPLAKRGVAEGTFMLLGSSLMMVGLGGLGGATLLRTQDASYAVLLPVVLLAVTIAVVGFAFMTPSIQALISRRSDPARQGEILGVNQSANAMSRILGPLAGVVLYQLQASHVMPYVFSVGLLVVVLLLTLHIRRV